MNVSLLHPFVTHLKLVFAACDGEIRLHFVKTEVPYESTGKVGS